MENLLVKGLVRSNQRIRRKCKNPKRAIDFGPPVISDVRNMIFIKKHLW